MFKRIRFPMSLFVAVLFAACDDGIGPNSADQGGPEFSRSAFGRGDRDARDSFTVLTRNVYIGADIAPIFGADFTDPVAISEAAASVWAAVQSTDFEDRAAALAEEIAEHRPRLVGLQEVARFITLDASFQPTGILDFLEILKSEMAAHGLTYEMIETQENTHVTMPIAYALEPDFHFTEYVDFTDRDVVLARSDVSIIDTDKGNYAANYPLVPGQVVLERGWIRVDTEYRGETFHFVNTHLEGQSLAPVQALQLEELVGSVLVGLQGVTVLVGDLNSDAEGGPGAPSWTPTYEELIDDGFVDTWEQANPRSRRHGYTCCHDPDLMNLRSSLDQRIDFVLVRTSEESVARRLMGSVHAEVLGDETEDLTNGGLWPSDHGGVFTTLHLDWDRHGEDRDRDRDHYDEDRESGRDPKDGRRGWDDDDRWRRH